MMERDDQTLVSDYLNNDPHAFTLIVERYSKQIYNFTLRLTGNPDEAYDITQEVFIKIWKNIRKYNHAQKFTTWMYSIARYTTIDWLRKRKSIRFSELDAHRDDEQESFESTLIDPEPLAHEIFDTRQKEEAAIETIGSAMNKISFDQRTVISLHHMQELTFAEIAQILSKPINTVQSHYRRGILALRKYIHAQSHE